LTSGGQRPASTTAKDETLSSSGEIISSQPGRGDRAAADAPGDAFHVGQAPSTDDHVTDVDVIEVSTLFR
jgi:hypothetical protein